MSIVVFATSNQEAAGAIEAANELLRYKHAHERAVGDDEILGIVVREGLHQGLPVWKSFCMKRGTGVLATARNSEAPDSPESGTGALALRSAFTSRGAWALCDFDGPGIRNAPDANMRMRRIAALLADAFVDSEWIFYCWEKGMRTLSQSITTTSDNPPDAAWLFYGSDKKLSGDAIFANVASDQISV